MYGRKLVVDTNVLVSAALQSLGLPAQALTVALTEPNRIYLSREIAVEYEMVLPRPRFRIYACTDPDDDKFVECAVAAKADYIITGNKKDFPDTIANIRVVTPREFLSLPV